MQLNKSFRNSHFQLHDAKFAKKQSRLLVPISGNCARPYVHLWRQKAAGKQVTIDLPLGNWNSTQFNYIMISSAVLELLIHHVDEGVNASLFIVTDFRIQVSRSIGRLILKRLSKIKSSKKNGNSLQPKTFSTDWRLFFHCRFLTEGALFLFLVSLLMFFLIFVIANNWAWNYFQPMEKYKYTSHTYSRI